MVLTAVETGHDWLVLTDHSPTRVANGLSVERLTKQIAIVDAITASLGGAFTLLKGIEVDIPTTAHSTRPRACSTNSTSSSPASTSKLKMNRVPMTKRMVTAASNPRVNVLGHCTGRLVTGSRGTRPQSEFDARKRSSRHAPSTDTAVEINSRRSAATPGRPDPARHGHQVPVRDRLRRPRARPVGHEGVWRAAGRAPRHTSERIVTTWDADRLRAWARRD